jgi:hypothetical protein
LLEGLCRRCRLSLEGNLQKHRRICVIVVPHPVTNLWPLRRGVCLFPSKGFTGTPEVGPQKPPVARVVVVAVVVVITFIATWPSERLVVC